MKFNFSLDAAIVLTLTTVFFYTSGQIYLNGSLSPFFVDSIVLNFSVQDKIYIGFLKGGNEYLYILSACLIMYVIRYVFIYFKIGKSIDKKILSYIPASERPNKHVLRIHNSEYYESLDQNYSTVALTTLFCIIISFGVLESFIHIEGKGKKLASDAMSQITKLPVVTSNGQDKEAIKHLLKCGSSLCAVIDEKKNVSLVEPKTIKILSTNFKK